MQYLVHRNSQKSLISELKCIYLINLYTVVSQSPLVVLTRSMESL